LDSRPSRFSVPFAYTGATGALAVAASAGMRCCCSARTGGEELAAVVGGGAVLGGGLDEGFQTGRDVGVDGDGRAGDVVEKPVQKRGEGVGAAPAVPQGRAVPGEGGCDPQAAVAGADPYGLAAEGDFGQGCEGADALGYAGVHGDLARAAGAAARGA